LHYHNSPESRRNGQRTFSPCCTIPCRTHFIQSRDTGLLCQGMAISSPEWRRYLTKRQHSGPSQWHNLSAPVPQCSSDIHDTPDVAETKKHQDNDKTSGDNPLTQSCYTSLKQKRNHGATAMAAQSDAPNSFKACTAVDPQQMGSPMLDNEH